MSKLVKYSLPRHTNLAKQTTRYGAAIIDIAIGLLLGLILFYGCFNLIFSNTMNNKNYSNLYSWELYSHLVYYDEATKSNKIYSSTEDYLVYEVPVQYYYLNYVTGVNIEVPSGGDTSHPEKYASLVYDKELTLSDGSKVLPKDYYTMEWFNINVLGIKGDKPESEQNSSFFTYKTDSSGNYIKNELGVPKSKRYDTNKSTVVEITKTDLASYFSEQYQEAYSHYSSLPFVSALTTEVNFINTVELMLSVTLSGLITYVIIPLFFKNGETLGKKIFKLGLANLEGYRYKKHQLLLRFIPFFITCVALTFIPATTLYFDFIIIAVMLLVSFGITMASPKKCAMHDYVARTIVIDTKTSIIFDNMILEEEYLKKEDKLEDEIIMGGEEPEISYEK